MPSRSYPGHRSHPTRRRLAFGAGIAAAALGASLLTAPAAQAADPVVLNLLTVNDFHGRIDPNTVKFAGTIEGLRAADGAGGANTLLIGAGDFIGASLFASSVAQDQPTIDVFNELGMVASAVGNHEFDAGWPDLRDRVLNDGNNAQWDYLGANVYLAGTTTPALPEYGLYEAAGLTVGIIGAVTQETPALVSPGGVVDLSFGDPVEAVNRVADQLTDGNEANGEADVLVATFHEGAPTGTLTLDQNEAISPVFARIVNEVSPKVAALVNGHTHQAYAYNAPVPGQPGATRPVLQTGNYAANVGQITLTVDPDTDVVSAYTVANVPRVTTADPTLIATYPRVAAVNTTVQAAITAAGVIGNQPIGTLGDDVTTAMTPGTPASKPYPNFERDDRSKESTLGNLVADAILDALAPPDRGGAEIAVVNPGGLRAELVYAKDAANPADSDGVILYAEANGVLPFVNNLATVDMTGAQLKTLLEQQWQRDANNQVPTRPYLQLGTSAGFSYTFDPALAEGSRITSMMFNGAPIDPAETYRVGTFTFLTGTGTPASAGGDNFWVFRQATNFRDSGLVDRDAWIAYLKAHPGVGPNFEKHAVSVSGLDATPIAGSTQTLTVGTLDLTSIDSPANTSLTAQFAATADGAGAVDIGSATVAGGAATIGVTFPASASGAGFLILTAQPTGTRVVIPVEVALPESTVSATAAAVQYGSSPKVKVTVASAGVTPTGTVTVSDAEGAMLGTAALTNGAATVSLGRTAVPPGTHTLTVSYSGSDTVAGSTTTVELVVKRASSTTVAIGSALIVKKGSALNITSFTVANGGVQVGGTVTVTTRGGEVLGTATVTNGRAKVALAPLTARGLQVLTVRYDGSATVAPSSGSVVVLVR
ncbi:5'-nucleotidase C-terminal domain-containing protein [Microbacterium pumilum]|uniref:Bifunctional metallophosphatase/5'-nucleotidase n=1 Tax=Microbacterium pumilum TaxID=344165 RepID=A0ABN2SK68_9MICO